MQTPSPLYQGQIDVFCAMYAVLNGLRITHGIRSLAARSIFHNTLLELAADRETFAEVLDQRTDYQVLVDAMLSGQVFQRPLSVRRPFAREAGTSIDEVWKCLTDWLGTSPKHAALFRFIRYLPPDGRPHIFHWSCGDRIENTTLYLFDSSREPGSLHALERAGLVCRMEDGGNDKVCLEPHTIRLLCPA